MRWSPHGVTTFCAPPTVWRMLIQEPLSAWQVNAARDHVVAGEPLNPEVIDQVRRAWGLTLRDGYGQTETTVHGRQSAGPEGHVRARWAGRCRAIASPSSTPMGSRADRGRDRADAEPRPVGLMRGYATTTGDRAVAGAYYRTGDVASRDAEGFITYVGRADDVFKSSDYRMSPFELESALIEHEAVVEAAVVPAPDLCVSPSPKAYVVLAPGFAPTAAPPRSIFAHVRERLSPYKRVRRIEFAELPKTHLRQDPPRRAARPRGRARREGRAVGRRIPDRGFFRGVKAAASCYRLSL